MRSYKTEGIVVKRKNFGEADRILTIFTKKNGKIIVRAPGIRRINSRRSAHVELLNHSLLTIHKSHSLNILIEASVINDFSEIKDDLTKIGFAYHLCELIDGLCPENQENDEVLFLLEKSLKYLGEEEDIVSIIHEFEIKLLTILGFYKQSYPFEKIDTLSFIERLLERKLKAKQFLLKLN